MTTTPSAGVPGQIASLTQTAEALGYDNLAQFRKDWTKLTPEDKDQLRAGIGNGSMTY